MTPLATKQHIMVAAGYFSDAEREIWYNLSARKVFSVDFIEDNNGSELERSICEGSDSREWRFYFKAEPSESVKREIVGALTSGRGRRDWGEFEV